MKPVAAAREDRFEQYYFLITFQTLPLPQITSKCHLALQINGTSSLIRLYLSGGVSLMALR